MPDHLRRTDLSERFTEVFDRPERVFDPPLIVPCRISLLVVTDGSGGFGNVQSFHLGNVIDVLTNDPWIDVQFSINKAHRGVSGESDVVDNFRFDSHDLSQYDEIWLFGVVRDQDPLSQPELKALAQFMDNGGGVFATGDHEDLGKAMSAEVPRVRSMRRWYHPSAGPNGEPVAPDQTGPDRHDTVMNQGAGGSQSDKIPQPIDVKLYTRRSGGHPVYRVTSYPHPILCGPNGRATYLPDHMHEGLVEVPADLTKSYTFDGYTTDEYPTGSSGRVTPEVIAEGTTRNTDGSQFGVIGAYDGHQASIGRVAVDSTWHHWFNINTATFVAVTDPSNPNYDPAVVPKWEDIKAYYRNVAKWLAPPPKQRCMRNGGLVATIGHHEVKMALRPLEKVTDTTAYHWQIGDFAAKALTLRGSPCERTRWVIDLDRWLLPYRVDPWDPPIPEPEPRPDPPPWFDLEAAETVLLGGAVHALWEAFGERTDLERLIRERPEEIEQAVAEGGQRALRDFLERQAEGGDQARQLAKHCG